MCPLARIDYICNCFNANQPLDNWRSMVTTEYTQLTNGNGVIILLCQQQKGSRILYSIILDLYL